MTTRASIIVPTRNRADVLSSCLASFSTQKIPLNEFEVLVVDNGSSDHTRDVARIHSASLQLSYLHAAEPGLHVGRHHGMRNARSDILVFVDDDILAATDWLPGILESFALPEVAMVGGNNLPLFEHQPPGWLAYWWREPVCRGQALGYLSILDFGEGRFDIDPGYIWGCNFAVRRHVLEQAGGFHPDALPSDRVRFRGDGETHVSDWVRASGHRAEFNGRASVQHRVPAARMTLDYFKQRAYAQGISDSYASIRKRRKPGGGLMARLDQRLLPLRHRLEQKIQGTFKTLDQDRKELGIAKIAVAEAYRRGYSFHQREASHDPRLLEWVLKENYLT